MDSVAVVHDVSSSSTVLLAAMPVGVVIGVRGKIPGERWCVCPSCPTPTNSPTPALTAVQSPPDRFLLARKPISERATIDRLHAANFRTIIATVRAEPRILSPRPTAEGPLCVLSSRRLCMLH